MRTAILPVLIVLLATTNLVAAQQQTITLYSPNGNIGLTIQLDERIKWSLKHQDDLAIAPSSAVLVLSDGTALGKNPRLRQISRRTVKDTISSPIYKRSYVIDHFNELTLRFRDNYSVIFRAYNDGIAYRFATAIRGDIRVKWEEYNLNLPDSNMLAFVPYLESRQQDVYASSFESLYEHVRIADIDSARLIYAPLVIEFGEDKKAAILEADVEDYPGMFLRLNNKSRQGFVSDFARFPLEQQRGGHNNLQAFVTKRADFIAHTKGTRQFPWRAVVISTNDKQLADNDMVFRLAAPTRIDKSWIKPGQVAWEWWHDWNIWNVDFEVGINNATYKYYIDFASDNGIEYVLLDEGWSMGSNLMQSRPEINLKEIIAFAKQRNVGIIIWAGWYPLNQDMENIMSHYAAMGVRGFKVDFMDRNDQEMVRFYYRVAEIAAKNRLLISLHGSYPPTGFQRTFPNVITSEGVRGLEYQKWENVDAPRHNVSIPFIRMLAGPLDYTPGAMNNANIHNFRPVHSNPMSQGTRCHQLAMYIIYESPLAKLADSPTKYKREQEIVDFITAIPSIFDQTVALAGSIGEYVSIARQKGDVWYVGAMTNWNARELTLDFSFLTKGEYKAVVFEDGINAHREGSDFVRREIIIEGGQQLPIKLAPGGGWAAILTPAK